MQSQKISTSRGLRRKLLGTASVVALIGLVQVPSAAQAGDNSMAGSDWHLTLDVVGQYTLNSGGRTIYGDPNFLSNPTVGLSDGGDGYLAFNLTKGDWVYGLSFNYGRTTNSHAGFSYSYPYYPYFYGSGEVRHNESHKIVDFTVGKDVGLGMFGREGSSVVSLGIEWANFAADTAGTFAYGDKYYYATPYPREIHRRFNGIGPVISWNASTPIGDPGSHLSLNWGVMGSVLFGTRTTYGVNAFPPRKDGGSVPRASGYLGVGWTSPDCPYAFSVGYGIQSSWGVFDGNFDDDGDENSFRVNRLSHGPYVDLTLHLH